MDIKEIYKHFQECDGVSTDTRQIQKDSMFFALKGDNFNGNEYAQDAISKGAKYAIIDEDNFLSDDQYIVVKDVLKTLQELANYHRRQFTIPFIAITGSNGKTTTKELLNSVLSKKYKTYATKGNLNNHIGVPLTILTIKKDVEMAVIEMGANHQKEIEGYCKIAEPTHGMITNIGKAHLEGFGGIEGVKKAKGELYEYLLKTGGTVFINSENEILKSISKFPSPVKYPGKGDFSHSELISASPFVKVRMEEGKELETHLIGGYNFENIAAALCIGKYFKVSPQDILEAVSSYDPQNNRSQVINKGSNSVIMDAYNANPSSMKAAVENFASMKAEHKILILGDMFELGDESMDEHKNLGKLIAKYSFEKVILCGKQMANAKATCPSVEYFSERPQLEEWLKKQEFKGANILIKGSRGMSLEKLLTFI
jgi:UDP-N-acetylmuramoyl-tripeptide--D-alanyl-D-alanine ligase